MLTYIRLRSNLRITCDSQLYAIPKTPPRTSIAPTAPGTTVTAAALFPLTEVNELVTGVVAVPRIPPFELDRPVPVVIVSLDIDEDDELPLADDEEVEVVGIDAPEVTRKDEAVSDVEDWAWACRARSERNGVRVRKRMVSGGLLDGFGGSDWQLA